MYAKVGSFSTPQSEEGVGQKCDKRLLTGIEHMCYFIIVSLWWKSNRSEMVKLEAKLLAEETPSGIEPDLPPEYCHYRDEGCDLANSCLNCPFPQCIYEQHGGRQHWLKKLRDREIARLFSSEGKGVKELALMFGVSQRTVQRALRSSLSTSPSQALLSSSSLHLSKAKNSGKGNTRNKGDQPGNE